MNTNQPATSPTDHQHRVSIHNEAMNTNQPEAFPNDPPFTQTLPKIILLFLARTATSRGHHNEETPIDVPSQCYVREPFLATVTVG